MFVIIFTFLFGFACGGVVLVLGVLWLLLRFLSHLDEKAEEFTSRKEKAAPDRASPSPLRKEASFKELKCYVKLQKLSESQNGPSRLTRWRFAALKSNSIFFFEDNTRESLVHVLSLDGCTVTLRDRNWASPTNAIHISHPDECLLEDSRDVYLFFAIGRELEEWFWAVQKGSQLSSMSDAILAEEERVQKHFSSLRDKILPQGEESASAPEAWVNALLPRLWWNIFDNRSFHRFISKRLGKRIAKITDFPRFIDCMVLQSLDIGPGLPYLSDVKLHDITRNGEVAVDMNVAYYGGFTMTIKIKTSMSLPGTSLELPATAILKVSKLCGRLRLHVSPPPCERFWIGFHELPETDIQAETEIALLDSQVAAIPRIATNIIKKLKADLTRVIVNKLKADIVGEKMVLPNMDDFPLPYFSHHEGEEREDYTAQVILSREEARDEQRKKRAAPPMLDISATGVTFMNRHIDSDQIMPLIKSYATRDGVRKLTTSGVRQLQQNRPTRESIKENMEKGRQALFESGMANPRNWKDPLYSNIEQVKDGLLQYGVMKAKKDMPPDYPRPSGSAPRPLIKAPSLSSEGGRRLGLLGQRKPDKTAMSESAISPRKHKRKTSTPDTGFDTTPKLTRKSSLSGSPKNP